MQLADRDNPCHHIFLLFRIRLMKHPLVPHTFGAGFVRIDPGNNQQLLLHFPVDFRKAQHVFQDCVLPVRGAGADDQEDPGIFPGQDIGDLAVPLFLQRFDLPVRRIIALDLLRQRHFPDKFHRHAHFLAYLPALPTPLSYSF